MSIFDLKGFWETLQRNFGEKVQKTNPLDILDYIRPVKTKEKVKRLSSTYFYTILFVELIVRANLPISLPPLFSTGIFISVWDSLQLEKWQILVCIWNPL